MNMYMHASLDVLVPCVMQDTGADLMPTDIKYYQEFGGEKVIFEKEEVTEMKKFGEPGMLVYTCEGYHMIVFFMIVYDGIYVFIMTVFISFDLYMLDFCNNNSRVQ